MTLLLVTFFTPEFPNYTADMHGNLNSSPYDGVAVPLVSAYDVDKHSQSDFQNAAIRFKNRPGKKIWPWIFLNRIVACDPARPVQSPSNKPYFKSIQGMDLFNKTGALHDFCDLYRFALRIAKQFGSPGIVIDPEVYNNYNLYSNANLAAAIGKSAADTQAILAAAGAKLTDIANIEYPDATIWWLFTGLNESGPGAVVNPQSRTITRIILGMLDRAKQSQSKLKFVSGGETEAGYCYLSLDDMKARLSAMTNNFKTVLQTYPSLSVGATIAPWDGSSPRKGWMAEDRCGLSAIQNLDGFKPLFTYMLENYKNVWIYADENAPYNPYDPSASAYNLALAGSLQAIA